MGKPKPEKPKTKSKSPAKRLKAWNERRKALRLIRKYSKKDPHDYIYDKTDVLPWRLREREIPTETIKSLVSALEAAAGAGHKSNRLANELNNGLKSGVITDKELRVMAPILTATAKAGHDPKDLASTLHRGLDYGKLTSAKIASMEAPLISAAQSGYRPWQLADILINKVFTNKKITDKEIGVVANSLIATTKAGHDPRHLAAVLGTGLKSNVITHKNLEESARDVKEILEATANANHNPESLAKIISEGLKSNDTIRMNIGGVHGSVIKTKKLNHKFLHQQSLIGKELPKKWSHANVFKHALKVKGVPKSRISTYQRMLIREGHFPNAGLIEALHKDHLKEMGKRE